VATRATQLAVSRGPPLCVLLSWDLKALAVSVRQTDAGSYSCTRRHYFLCSPAPARWYTRSAVSTGDDGCHDVSEAFARSTQVHLHAHNVTRPLSPHCTCLHVRPVVMCAIWQFLYVIPADSLESKTLGDKAAASQIITKVDKHCITYPHNMVLQV
jgi:hypothetical protein